MKKEEERCGVALLLRLEEEGVIGLKIRRSRRKLAAFSRVSPEQPQPTSEEARNHDRSAGGFTRRPDLEAAPTTTTSEEARNHDRSCEIGTSKTQIGGALRQQQGDEFMADNGEQEQRGGDQHRTRQGDSARDVRQHQHSEGSKANTRRGRRRLAAAAASKASSIRNHDSRRRRVY